MFCVECVIHSKLRGCVCNELFLGASSQRVQKCRQGGHALGGGVGAALTDACPLGEKQATFLSSLVFSRAQASSLGGESRGSAAGRLVSLQPLRCVMGLVTGLLCAGFLPVQGGGRQL